jgi:hypothetical protein
MKLAPFALISIMLAASLSWAESLSRSPKIGYVYSCRRTFSMTVWSDTGVKGKTITEGPSRVLVRVLEAELERTSFFRDEASVGHFPITSRDDDSVTAVNSIGKDGNQYPGKHVLHGLTDQVAVDIDSSTYRNGGGGITVTTQNGTCRRSR